MADNCQTTEQGVSPVWRYLCLDDSPARLDWFRRVLPGSTCVETATEAIAFLAAQAWDEVYLDHDLGDETFADSDRADTGFEVVRWICANRPQIGRLVVHSMNTPAGNRMVSSLRDAGYTAVYVPFVRLIHLVS